MTTHFVSSVQPYSSFQQASYWPGHTSLAMMPQYHMPYTALGSAPLMVQSDLNRQASPRAPQTRVLPNRQKALLQPAVSPSPRQQTTSHVKPAQPQSDIFRDAPLRYMGYLNELGESFRGVIPNAVVKASYQLTGAYCVADAVSKGISGYKNGSGDSTQRAAHALSEAADAGAFQFLASYYVPAKIIEVASGAARRYAKQQATWSARAQRVFPTAVGLGLVPFLVGPVDRASHFLLNHTLRDVLGRPHKSH